MTDENVPIQSECDDDDDDEAPNTHQTSATESADCITQVVSTAIVDKIDHMRVMVFQLNSERQWDDQGTGILEFISLENNVELCVRGETSDEILLSHQVSHTIEYTKQGDSIVTWFDVKLDNDVAISFQEVDGCESIWQRIQSIKNGLANINMAALNDEVFNSNTHLVEVNLPLPSLESIESIAISLLSVHPSQRDNVTTTLTNQVWLDALFAVHSKCIDLECIEALRTIFNIVKRMFAVNAVVVIETLLNQANAMKIISCLEYDPDLPDTHAYDTHTTWIQASRLKDIIPIQNECVLSKIRQAYLILYLRDVILLRHLDDSANQILSSMHFFNTVAILTPLAKDKSFIDRLISSVKENTSPNNKTNLQSRKDVFEFLLELCNIAKTQQIRKAFFQSLCDAGLLNALEKALCSCSESWLLDLVASVLLMFATHDPSLLRLHMIAQTSEPVMLIRIVNIICGESNFFVSRALVQQLTDVLSSLLDVDSLQFSTQDAFMSCFFIPSLIHRIMATLQNTNRMIACRYFGLELLTFTVTEHCSAVKPLLITSPFNISTVITSCMQPRSPMQLQLVAIRFVRACLRVQQLGTDSLTHLIASQHVLEPILQAFHRNGCRYNLLNSSILDLLEHIRTSNIRVLIDELIEKHSNILSNIHYVNMFTMLKVKYEQNNDTSIPAVSSDISSAIHVNESASVDARENAYFCEANDNDALSDSINSLNDDDVKAAEHSFVDRQAFLTASNEQDFISIVAKRQHNSSVSNTTIDGESVPQAKRRRKVSPARRASMTKKTKTHSKNIKFKLVNYPIDDDDDEDNDDDDDDDDKNDDDDDKNHSNDDDDDDDKNHSNDDDDKNHSNDDDDKNHSDDDDDDANDDVTPNSTSLSE